MLKIKPVGYHDKIIEIELGKICYPLPYVDGSLCIFMALCPRRPLQLV